MSRFTLTVLGVGSSCLVRQKSDMCTRAGSLTFHSRDQFAMRFWRTVLPRSIIGFRIQAGSLSVCEAKKTFNTQCGSCACHTFVTHLSRQAIRERCSREKLGSYI